MVFACSLTFGLAVRSLSGIWRPCRHTARTLSELSHRISPELSPSFSFFVLFICYVLCFCCYIVVFPFLFYVCVFFLILFFVFGKMISSFSGGSLLGGVLLFPPSCCAGEEMPMLKRLQPLGRMPGGPPGPARPADRPAGAPVARRPAQTNFV